MAKQFDERSFYGSGKVYTMKLTNPEYPIFTRNNIIKMLKILMTKENQLGYVKGGFKFGLETEKLDDQSDLGEMKINIITKEKGTATFALFNANGETIARVYPTGHSEDIEDDDGTVSVTEVGGLEHMDDSLFLIAFHHQDKTNGDSIAVAVGKNMQGFEANWTPDSVTPFQCQFECQPYSKSGKVYSQVETPVGYPWTDFTDEDEEALEIESIAVTTQPTKTTYNVGDTLDVTGAKITATYSDSTEKVIDVTADMCSGFDSSTAGTKTVTVIYRWEKATFTVTVS